MLKCIVKDECMKISESICQTNGTCFSATKKSNCHQQGCLDQNTAWFYCRNNETITFKASRIACCNRMDFCNKIILNDNELNEIKSTKIHNFLILLGPIIIILILIWMIYQNADKCLKKCKKVLKSTKLEAIDKLEHPNYVPKHLYITLQENIGEGRYGKVLKGIYNDQKVAVKIFDSKDYDSYKKEEAIYMIPSLSRESILKCIAVDQKTDWKSGVQYWLILDFCELGSLYDYLQRKVLEKDQLLSIMLSAISGLNHLHDDQSFTISKPSISHRDLKSKNLLMRTDQTVCIADFGLSITKNEIQSKQYPKLQTGTKRYFSPEVLDETLDVTDFDSFILSDIYSYSLVFWESLNQSKFNCRNCGFKLPYFEYTNNDPSIEEMKEIVVTKNLRPNLNFYDDCRSICELIKTCWSPLARNRLSSSQIKEKLEDLYLNFEKK